MTTLNSLIHAIGIVAFGLAIVSTGQPMRVSAHEGHQMECNDASINAMKADIQAMPDGKSKTAANAEMRAAQDMMRKRDMKNCMAHLDKAMHAMEQ